LKVLTYWTDAINKKTPYGQKLIHPIGPQVRVVEDKDGRSFSFEVYSDSNSLVKGCKTDSRGTVVQGNHKSYR
jgi:hypothetical protein